MDSLRPAMWIALDPIPGGLPRAQSLPLQTCLSSCERGTGVRVSFALGMRVCYRRASVPLLFRRFCGV